MDIILDINLIVAITLGIILAKFSMHVINIFLHTLNIALCRLLGISLGRSTPSPSKNEVAYKNSST